MQRLFNSLTARLILVAVLGTSLVVSLVAISWQSITRLVAISANVTEAEDNENILLSLPASVTSAANLPDERAAYDAQIRALLDEFDKARDELNTEYPATSSDPNVQAVAATLADTDAQWNKSRALIEQFLSTSDNATRLELANKIHQSLVNTNVYANRNSEALRAMADRQQQNTLFGFAIVAVATGVLIALTVSIIVQVVRSMQGLTGVATAYSGGIYSVRADTHTLDEIAALGQTFNGMADSIKLREASLRDANETLEQRVRARTLDLEKATAEAREASRAKDEFLSVMSHELRTPLNAILGYQGILEMTGELNADNLEMVQRTEVNARRLLGLINDVLDISRIEAGRMEIVPGKVYVREFASQVKSQMGVLASEKGLGFDVQVDESLPDAIMIDEDALNKIVTNLLGNAFKFTEQGRVGLNLAASNGDLQIAVRDTGVGIPAHMHQIIFERFRQADSSTTRKHGGSGLGLSIVQQLCTLMGGTVVVESAPGTGSIFIASLPVAAVREMEGAPA